MLRGHARYGKQRLAFSSPDAILVIPTKRVPWTNSRYPLRKLGLDTKKATKLALKLLAHSVQYAYKIASTRSALEKTSFNSHHQDQGIHGALALGPFAEGSMDARVHLDSDCLASATTVPIHYI
eukprot:1142881-Pelagomonas_calceolata.AAC.4